MLNINGLCPRAVLEKPAFQQTGEVAAAVGNNRNRNQITLGRIDDAIWPDRELPPVSHPQRVQFRWDWPTQGILDQALDGIVERVENRIGSVRTAGPALLQTVIVDRLQVAFGFCRQLNADWRRHPRAARARIRSLRPSSG